MSALPAAAAGRTPTGRLVIAQGIDPRSLFANNSTAQQEINISEQITEKLIEFNADATDFEPRLATDWRQVDPTTLELKLRQNVKFTNGEPFNADSAVVSLGEMLKAPAYRTFTSMIDRAEKVDDHTIRVILKNPTLLHMPALAMGSFQYPPKLLEELGPDEFGKRPVGTGPFTFVEWRKDDRITLEANRDYWGGPPAYQTVIFRNIPEGAARIAALEAGEIDLAIDVPLDAVDRLSRNTSVQLPSRPSNRIFTLTLSKISDSPISNVKVRQALQYAVDVDGLIRGLFRGRAKRLQGQPLTPSFFGFDAAREPKPYNPDLARQMIAEAGYPSGFEFTFKYSAGRYVQDKETGQAIATQLQRIGLRPNQVVLEPGTFLTELTSKKLNDMFLGGTLPPPDAHFMYQQFASDFRYSYYENAQFDELLARGAASPNRDERLAIYRQILDLFEQDPALVPLYAPEDIYGLSTKVTGFTPRASQYIDVRELRPS